MSSSTSISTDSWRYKFFVGVGYAGISTLLLYEAFNLEAGQEGLMTLNDLFLDWDKSPISITAWILTSIFVALEGGTNVTILDPQHEAKRILSIKDEEPMAYSLLESQEEKTEAVTENRIKLINCTPGGLTSLLLVLSNCAVAGIASMIPIHSLMGITPVSLAIMLPMSMLSFAYQLLLGTADAIEAYDEMAKGEKSVYGLLWKLNRCQFIRCTVEGFIMTNIYFSVISAYVLMRVFDEIFNLPGLILPLQIFSTLSVIYSLTPRHERLYAQYLKPFRSGNHYNLSLITHKDRNEAWGHLNCSEKAKFYLYASIYSLAVMGVSLYFSDKYLAPILSSDHHRTISNTIVASSLGLMSFSFVFYTDWQHRMNQLAINHRSLHNFDEIYSVGVKLLAFLFNSGSQITRGICMVTFFIAVLGKILPSIDLVMICSIVTMTVGSTNFAYYKPKLHRRLKEWEQSIYSFFQNRKRDGDSHGYYTNLEESQNVL